MFYTLGNLEKSGRQFDKLSSKVRRTAPRTARNETSAVKGLDRILACSIQSGHDCVLLSLAPSGQICRGVLQRRRLQLGLVDGVLSPATFELSARDVVERHSTDTSRLLVGRVLLRRVRDRSCAFSGTHHKKTCSNESDIARWTETDKFYHTNRQHLFPTNPLSTHLKYEAKRPVKQTNGGWSDVRDRQLCLSFALQNSTDLSRVSVTH